MSYSRRSDYSPSPSPRRRYSRSISNLRSVSRSRSRSASSDVENPGNNLYVTGLSPRITKRELENHFVSEGKVVDVHLVVDPWTRESRGFGFVTMSTVKEAERCIKCLDRSVLEGRVITVEKARRRRGRTPTPGRYLGLKTIRVRRRSPSYSPPNSPRRTPSCSPYSRSRSPRYSSDHSRGRSYSSYHRRRRSDSPYYGRRRAYSPCYSRRKSYSRSRSPYSRSPVYHCDRSYSPYDSRDYSPDDRYHRRSRYRSISRTVSSGRGRYSRSSYSPRLRRSRYYPSESPKPRRRSRKSYRSTSRSPRRSSKRSYSSRRGYSRDSYSSRSVSPSHSVSASSRAVSRSNTPRSSSSA
ncbi:serine/arginine-rich splicing factor SR45a isoform X2 [Rhodamnia argentea]|nr:serine/arginine-rich splicing factor SR45a isoform X2 [Rhodamnia argentea]